MQKVELGLQLHALKLLCEASRKADEELQSYTQDCVETSSISETYMTLANFCDKQLRKEEQNDAGESFGSLHVNAQTLFPFYFLVKRTEAVYSVLCGK